jgi:hypothetical protein
MRKERITGFAGKVDHLELEHVIQIACLAGITATILVRQGNQKGYIYVRSGQILHAVAGGLTGQEAVNEMVFWRVGRFDLKHGVAHSIPRTLATNSTGVILEATRVLDERIAEAEVEVAKSEQKRSVSKSLHISRGGAAEILKLIIENRKRNEWRSRVAKFWRSLPVLLLVALMGYLGYGSRDIIESLVHGFGKKPVVRSDHGGSISIPAGPFYFQDGRLVTLPQFGIDPTEVTIWQYAEFLAAAGESPYGVLDMAGNVSEWTSSVDPSGNPVIRGGNFGSLSAEVTRRVTNQRSLTLSDRIGFRTVGDR